jgi:hypothetical protein
MAADVSAMTDMAEGGFPHDGPQQLMATLEALPQLAEMTAGAMHELAEFMSGQGGVLEEAGADMHDQAAVMEGIFDGLSDIFLTVKEQAHFWLDGD